MAMPILLCKCNLDSRSVSGARRQQQYRGSEDAHFPLETLRTISLHFKKVEMVLKDDGIRSQYVSQQLNVGSINDKKRAT